MRDLESSSEGPNHSIHWVTPVVKDNIHLCDSATGGSVSGSILINEENTAVLVVSQVKQLDVAHH